MFDENLIRVLILTTATHLDFLFSGKHENIRHRTVLSFKMCLDVQKSTIDSNSSSLELETQTFAFLKQFIEARRVSSRKAISNRAKSPPRRSRLGFVFKFNLKNYCPRAFPLSYPLYAPLILSLALEMIKNSNRRAHNEHRRKNAFSRDALHSPREF